MGIIRMGPPQELILHLVSQHEEATFVETGTYLGDTALWAASRFARVVTIENSHAIYEKTVSKLKYTKNIEFRFGDSRTQLDTILSGLKSTAVIWLDSHWCGSESYGANDQCPLLDELAVINRSSVAHYLFIDDARLFLSPPPLPNAIDAWPTIDRICHALAQGSYRRYVVVFEDVIIAVPFEARALLANWCQDANTQAWRRYGEEIRRRQSLERPNGAGQMQKCMLFAIGMIGRKLKWIISRHTRTP